MRLLQYGSRNFQKELEAFCATASAPKAIQDSVSAILADVRERGDAAVSHYAEKFDKAVLKPRQFRVDPAEIAAAAKRISAADRRAIIEAQANVRVANTPSLQRDWTAKNKQGALVGECFYPLRRVGLYIPGGQVPLVSTVIMTATLAKLAGVPEIAAFTPSDAKGNIPDGLLAALHLSGVTEVYRIGGVQAVGAMAYGTATIPAVDKVFGPGNAYVCEAKRQVFGTIGVDLLPGPSEVMIIADKTARLDFAAADLLAQAEHGSGREKIYLVATSWSIIEGIMEEIEKQLETLGRSDAVRRVLTEGFLAIEVASLDEAVPIANYVAPEHLELLVADGAVKKLLRGITTAGAIMIGNYTPTALGDFTAGPSHVLPTARAGVFSSGLRVTDFQRRTSIIRYDKASIVAGSRVVGAFARMERLDAHGRSAEIRTR